MPIELNSEERRMLLNVLEEMLPDLREEIRRTDDFDMRESLKRREAFLRQLCERLEKAVS